MYCADMYRVGDMIAFQDKVGKVIQTWSTEKADGVMVDCRGQIHRLTTWVSRHADIAERRQVVQTQRLLDKDKSPVTSISSYSGPDDRNLEFPADFADLEMRSYQETASEEPSDESEDDDEQDDHDDI
jgi:hypothetical protein